MPSPAALNYERTAKKARILGKTATDTRLRPMSREQIQVYYHAALAAFVAAWDAYIAEGRRQRAEGRRKTLTIIKF
ncbi:MAG: hypothetical protein DSM107014_16660 [Gomphosphaeria aponina SAG 52.96 = DSM 107014]|uniref:Uncharacterized protein n=1 Tax=Gomphosphaeria aponina SAG 52.96 = DSM 107014 TaxID=1521640 RepID=A0A941GWU7_9CHRO|nr:hypothetical protein [Gomphosphaeria aponina SAG 52.96 = DSM 107014]